MRATLRAAAGLLGLFLALVAGCSDTKLPAGPTPNILFIVMDDVGIDQMKLFGYGGDTPPSTPNIDQIAAGGIIFHNTWAMPACTTSRAVIFDGRYPLRTNVYAALGPSDLANSQVSPYEMTVPKVLALRDYQSGLFGKFHLGLQENNPAGYAMPHALGWNFFSGWLDYTGDPSSIDTTAGGVAPAGTWSCGFVPSARLGGADAGACYHADGSCEAMSSDKIPPGRTCRDAGGIFDPGKACQSPVPGYVDFTILSGHYVSPLVINHEDGSVEQVPSTDIRARTFRTTVAVDDAVAWINQRPAGQPWMASVTFSAEHTPLMQPPVDQIPADGPDGSDLDCLSTPGQRTIANLMVESLDHEVGRLLVETGLAHRGDDGRLIYDPSRNDTMIVVVGDNGSLGTTVKVPFDPSRAKGTAYQTGVWVPLVVAGPLVNRPNRIVNQMVNVADLFELFGEIAGVDVHQVVPRPIDSQAMLPYLKNPKQESIRKTNFTQVGPNLQKNNGVNGPCVIASTCTQIPVTQSVCQDNNGTWYGDGSTVPGVPPGGFARCCNVNAFFASTGQELTTIAPDYASAMRNDRYKVVENTTMEYVSQEEPCVQTIETEFYEINEDVPDPLIDTEDRELPLDHLTPEQQQNYDALLAEMNALLASSPACPGDGNIDFVVNQTDIDDWRFYSENNGLSSVYDLNLDGLTNSADESIIQQHLGTQCPKL